MSIITVYEVSDMNQEKRHKSKYEREAELARIRKEKYGRDKTVGELAVEIFRKGTYESSPVDLEREMQRDYYQNLIDCVLNNRKIYQGRFYIVVITKAEPVLLNTMRNYFLARRTCPTPDYDQSVFRYNYITEEVEYMWTIPSKDACFHLMNNAKQVHKDEWELLSYVLQFHRGSLFGLAKRLNGEKDTSSQLDRKEYIP